MLSDVLHETVESDERPGPADSGAEDTQKRSAVSMRTTQSEHIPGSDAY